MSQSLLSLVVSQRLRENLGLFVDNIYAGCSSLKGALSPTRVLNKLITIEGESYANVVDRAVSNFRTTLDYYISGRFIHMDLSAAEYVDSVIEGVNQQTRINMAFQPYCFNVVPLCVPYFVVPLLVLLVLIAAIVIFGYYASIESPITRSLRVYDKFTRGKGSGVRSWLTHKVFPNMDDSKYYRGFMKVFQHSNREIPPDALINGRSRHRRHHPYWNQVTAKVRSQFGGCMRDSAANRRLIQAYARDKMLEHNVRPGDIADAMPYIVLACTTPSRNEVIVQGIRESTAYKRVRSLLPKQEE